MSIWLNSNIEAHDFVQREYWIANIEFVRQSLPNAEIYIYEDNDSIEGFLGVIDEYIAGIFVNKRYRSLGIGKKLLDNVKIDKNQLSLSVYEKNKRAINFYRREGFSVEAQQFDKDTNESELLMTWNKG